MLTRDLSDTATTRLFRGCFLQLKTNLYKPKWNWTLRSQAHLPLWKILTRGKNCVSPIPVCLYLAPHSHYSGQELAGNMENSHISFPLENLDVYTRFPLCREKGDEASKSAWKMHVVTTLHRKCYNEDKHTTLYRNALITLSVNSAPREQ